MSDVVEAQPTTIKDRITAQSWPWGGGYIRTDKVFEINHRDGCLHIKIIPPSYVERGRTVVVTIPWRELERHVEEIRQEVAAKQQALMEAMGQALLTGDAMSALHYLTQLRECA